MPEQLFKDPVEIHSMAVESPAPSSEHFSVEQLLTPEVSKALFEHYAWLGKELVKRLYSSEIMHRLVYNAEGLRILFGKEAAESIYDNSTFEKMMHQFLYVVKPDQGSFYYDLLSIGRLACTWPEKVARYSESIARLELQVKNQTHVLRATNSDFLFLRYLRVLFPSYDISRYIDRWESRLSDEMELAIAQGKYREYIRLQAGTRLLIPSKVAELFPDEQHQKIIQDYLSALSPATSNTINDEERFTVAAADAKIIFAPRVELTRQGIIFPEEPVRLENDSALPVQRRY